MVNFLEGSKAQISIRERFGRPSESELTQHMPLVASKVFTGVRQALENGRDDGYPALVNIMDGLSKENSPLSPADITAIYVENIVDLMNESGIKCAEQTSRESKVIGAIVMDLASGIAASVFPVNVVHSKEVPQSSPNPEIRFIQFGNDPVVFAIQQSVFETMRDIFAKDKNKTGYSLIEWQITQIMTAYWRNKYTKPYQVWEVFKQGAIMGLSYYKEIYPATLNVLAEFLRK